MSFIAHSRRTAVSLSVLSLAALGAAACTRSGADGGRAGAAGQTSSSALRGRQAAPSSSAPGGRLMTPSSLAPQPEAPAASAGRACTPVEVLAARGTAEPQAGSIIMGGLPNDIAQRAQGSVYQVKYPASINYLTGPGQGADDALKRLTERSRACPNQKYVLVGYSEGAMVMTSLMGQIPASLKPRVVAAVLYGNPYYKSSSPAAAGSAKGQANGLVPVLGVPTDFAGKTRDYCNSGDPVCGAGANVTAHLSYSQHNAEAVSFVMSKL